MEFTKKQIEDITARELECLEFLKEHQMAPAVKMMAVNAGNDYFCMKPIPFLNDLKYSEDKKIQDLPIAK